MSKHLFMKGKQGGITCQGDYMDEKLSAYSRKNQQIALNTIQVAYENNNYHNGVITQKVKKSGVNTVLLGNFDILGEIVFIDSVMHPDMPKYADKYVPVCGRNAYP